MLIFAGAVRWQGAVSKIGAFMAAAGVLLMLLTAWKSFGAAEIEGQVFLGQLWQCLREQA